MHATNHHNGHNPQERLLLAMPPVKATAAGNGRAAAAALSRGMADLSMGDAGDAGSLGETQNYEFKENNEKQETLDDIDDFERRLRS